MTAIAGGKGSSADVLHEINRRRAEVGALTLKLKPAVTGIDEDSGVPLKFFDKAKWLERVATLGVAALGQLTNPYNPTLVRQVLRAFGVTRIVVKRSSDGWTFEGWRISTS